MKHPKHPGVYAIIHIETGRRYIGSAKNIYHRWRGHLSDLRRGVSYCRYLQNAWNKYGEAAFRFEVLEACLGDVVMIRAREQWWLDHPGGRLFNIRKNADPGFGVPRTAEEKAAASARMMGNKRGEGTHYHGHLTEADILDIMTRYAAGETRESLAKRFETCTNNISRIASRRIWWRVEVPPEIVAACLARTKRRATGARNNKSKLHSHIDEIKVRIAAGERTCALAKEFGVSPTAISHIKFGRNHSASS